MKETGMQTSIPVNCSEAEHLIHLDVGDDLRMEEKEQLTTHIKQCGECRSYHADMSSAMSALLTLRDNPITAAESVSKSVWPSLSREIDRRRTSPRVARKFNLQVVALSVCSLSLAVVTLVQSLSSMRNYRLTTDFMPAQTVSNQSQMLPYQVQPLSSPQYRPADDEHSPRRTPMLPHDAPVSRPQSF